MPVFSALKQTGDSTETTTNRTQHKGEKEKVLLPFLEGVRGGCELRAKGAQTNESKVVHNRA